VNSIPVSLQLWSVRQDTQKDFARTVAEVAAIGYTGVELAGYGNLDAKGVKTAVDAAGLKVSGMHAGIAALRTDPDQVVQDALLFGTRHVIVPWLPPALFTSVAAVENIGEELNTIGARLRGFGLQLSYHNHNNEFKLLEGRPVFDWLLGASEPRHLAAEVDVYWVHVGGYSPAKFIRDYGARVKLLHLKDETELGGGPVDFAEVFAAVESVGAAEWYVVEQEQYNYAPLECVRLDFAQLRRWGKA
jgi:sugar phosphate isomerase/epimerase